MNRFGSYPLGLTFALLAMTPSISNADVTFTSLEVGSNVDMNSSGTLETANLIPGTYGGWGGTGVGHFNPVAMAGGTDAGVTDRPFAFNTVTDYSEWAPGVPWTRDTFGWSFTGVKGFATYDNSSGGFRPGIHLRGSDMVGTTWTPDQAWTISGSFASLGFDPGTYTVSDILTEESITYQIGPIGTVFCSPAKDNSTGSPGKIKAFGSLDVTHDNLCITATGLPVNQNGFVLNSMLNTDLIDVPNSGTLCIGPCKGRHDKTPGNSGASGNEFKTVIDLNALPRSDFFFIAKADPGSTWYFQVWYRDSGSRPSNFTDAICITFVP